MKKIINNIGIVRTIILAVTFTFIIISGILTGQAFWKMLPLFVSLVVMLLQSDANRYGYLLGGLNSCLYAAVDFSYGIYASAASALLMSFPLQMVTFINWSKHSYKSSVVFKRFSAKARMLLCLCFAVVWVGVYFVLKATGSHYAILDNTQMLLGIIVTVFTMLAYMEYSYIWLVQGVITIFLNLQVVMNDPSRITYFVYSLYSYYCIVMAFINVRSLCKEQQGGGCKISADRL